MQSSAQNFLPAVTAATGRLRSHGDLSCVPYWVATRWLLRCRRFLLRGRRYLPYLPTVGHVDRPVTSHYLMTHLRLTTPDTRTPRLVRTWRPKRPTSVFGKKHKALLARPHPHLPLRNAHPILLSPITSMTSSSDNERETNSTLTTPVAPTKSRVSTATTGLSDAASKSALVLCLFQSMAGVIFGWGNSSGGVLVSVERRPLLQQHAQNGSTDDVPSLPWTPTRTVSDRAMPLVCARSRRRGSLPSPVSSLWERRLVPCALVTFQTR